MTSGGLQPVPRVGVGAVVLDGEDLLLIERGRPPRQGQWAVPGGKVRWRETLEAAVAREVLEETGLVVEVGDLIWTGETIGPDWHFVLMDFEARVIGGTLIAGDDAARVAWVPVDEAHDLPLTSSMFGLLEILKGRRDAT